MSTPSLPPEILDLIVDHLHDEPTTLRTCSLVSESWVPRTRTHLFNRVEFQSSGPGSFESWMETFPDPSNSPARYTRSLHFSRFKLTTVTVSDALPWIHSFDQIVELGVVGVGEVDNHHISFPQLRGISPIVKYLHISHSFATLSEVLDLIFSFPLIEDLSLSRVVCHSPEDADSWDAPPTLPRFARSLLLIGDDRYIARKLLDLPGGLRFTKVVMLCPIGNCDLVEELVAMCSENLVYLFVDFYRVLGDPWKPPSLDLSKAMKLRDLEFRLREPSVKWVNAALRTAKSNALRYIVIHVSTISVPLGLLRPIDEAIRLEWQELDHLLVQSWTTRSIYPVFTYDRRERVSRFGVPVLDLLPELTKRVAVDEV